MKAIILLILGLLLLGGAGYGGWMLYNTYIVGEKAAEPPPPKDVPPPPVYYLRLNPIVVPMVGKEKVEQFVTVVATIEVDAAKQAHAQGNVPRLIDAFISTLYGALDDKSVMNGGVVNIPAVKQKLSAAAEKVLGPGVSQGVLVQVVTQRNL